ncbi:hypothetical protein M758_8G036800 [Ceratodon purpureus]|nr:hypothetical protein M758_8G036800 [Ceratodon purpureus]
MRGNGRELHGPSWEAPSSFSDENPLHAWGGPGGAACHGSPNSLALEAGAPRWNYRPSSEKHHCGARHEYTGMQPRPVAEHRQGWGGDQHHFHAGAAARPWSETKLDRMMAMYESQITRTVSNDHFAAIAALGHENLTLQLASEKLMDISLQRSGSDAGSKQEGEAQSLPKTALVGTSSDLKRKRLEIAICAETDQAECGWSHPLKLLVRKGLSVSDVGELGRIIIPKRFAESKFQQIDAKEGTLLEMEDYNGSKRWFFRFKYWINNKSRMYVLENTGEFIKYHSLKEHDIFVVYEDSVKKLVVRGHKGTDLDSMPDVSPQGTNPRISTDNSTPTREEGPASTTVIA